MPEPEPQPDERQELIIFLKSGQTVRTDVRYAQVVCDNLGEIIRLHWDPDPDPIDGHNRMLGVSPSEIAAVLIRPAPRRDA
jgi:hypothetical protein